VTQFKQESVFWALTRLKQQIVSRVKKNVQTSRKNRGMIFPGILVLKRPPFVPANVQTFSFFAIKI
jgi:hypothetical protein